MEEPKISTKSITEKGSSYKTVGGQRRHSADRGFLHRRYPQGTTRALETHGGIGGAYLPAGTGETNDAYICEIPPGKALEPQKHMFEELIYVVSGRGATTVWNEGEPKHTFEWQEGSVFSPPLNSWHQNFNGNGSEPARYLAVTSAPCMINLIHNTDFIFNCHYVFSDRYDSQADYFSNPGTWYSGRTWKTNFVADVKNLKLT